MRGRSDEPNRPRPQSVRPPTEMCRKYVNRNNKSAKSLQCGSPRSHARSKQACPTSSSSRRANSVTSTSSCGGGLRRFCGGAVCVAVAAQASMASARFEKSRLAYSLRLAGERDCSMRLTIYEDTNNNPIRGAAACRYRAGEEVGGGSRDSGGSGGSRGANDQRIPRDDQRRIPLGWRW